MERYRLCVHLFMATEEKKSTTPLDAIVEKKKKRTKKETAVRKSMYVGEESLDQGRGVVQEVKKNINKNERTPFSIKTTTSRRGEGARNRKVEKKSLWGWVKLIS